MNARRIQFRVGVTYDTSPDKVAAAVSIIKKALIDASTTVDRVHFLALGDSALVIEAVYLVNSPEYQTYCDAQQAINLQIMRDFQDQGIEFAFPTQTIHLQAPQRSQA